MAGVEQLHSNCCVLTSKPTVIFWDILLGRGYDAHEHDFWNPYYTISTARFVLHQTFITLNNGEKLEDEVSFSDGLERPTIEATCRCLILVWLCGCVAVKLQGSCGGENRGLEWPGSLISTPTRRPSQPTFTNPIQTRLHHPPAIFWTSVILQRLPLLCLIAKSTDSLFLCSRTVSTPCKALPREHGLIHWCFSIARAFPTESLVRSAPSTTPNSNTPISSPCP